MTDKATPDGRVADAVEHHWADRLLPAPLRPYARLMRIERPIGWWLLLLPGWWAIALAQVSEGGGWPDVRSLALFLFGAVVMRGAGCTLNDIVDRDLDRQVARTRSRPIPSGQVTVRVAVLLLGGLAGLGLAILLQFNWFAVALGALSLLLVAIYPFMKRLTDWPQLVLGLAFNWGALLGWAAVKGSIGAPAILLYAGGVCWTLAYDTIYAHQDKEDDALIGVKSTALKFGTASKPWIAGFFILGLALIDLAGVLAGANFWFHLAVALAACHAAWQVSQLDISDPVRCLKLFRSNRDLGLIIFAGALLASLTQGGSGL